MRVRHEHTVEVCDIKTFGSVRVGDLSTNRDLASEVVRVITWAPKATDREPNSPDLLGSKSSRSKGNGIDRIVGADLNATGLLVVLPLYGENIGGAELELSREDERELLVGLPLRVHCTGYLLGSESNNGVDRIVGADLNATGLLVGLPLYGENVGGVELEQRKRGTPGRPSLVCALYGLPHWLQKHQVGGNGIDHIVGADLNPIGLLVGLPLYGENVGGAKLHLNREDESELLFGLSLRVHYTGYLLGSESNRLGTQFSGPSQL
ncbi:hypothetical protein U1Q18_015512 [Sarracenia purpurea var. burkii]